MITFSLCIFFYLFHVHFSLLICQFQSDAKQKKKKLTIALALTEKLFQGHLLIILGLENVYSFTLPFVSSSEVQQLGA